jgi:hypothetical protein
LESGGVAPVSSRGDFPSRWRVHVRGVEMTDAAVLLMCLATLNLGFLLGRVFERVEWEHKFQKLKDRYESEV